MYCKQCGERIDGDARFCPSCGVKLAVQTPGGGTNAQTDRSTSPKPGLVETSDEQAIAAQNKKTVRFIWIGSAAVLLMIVLAVAVGPSTTEPYSGNEQVNKPAPDLEDVGTSVDRIPIKIRTMAGEPEQDAFLVSPLKPQDFELLAGMLREYGFPCERMTAFNQLEQTGRRMDIYKAECLGREYQITFIDGNTHIKDWSGNIIGE